MGGFFDAYLNSLNGDDDDEALHAVNRNKGILWQKGSWIKMVVYSDDYLNDCGICGT